MAPKKVNKNKKIKSTKSKKSSWLNKRLALKYFWPIFGILFLLFLLTIFNLLSLWQIREEMNANMESLKSNIYLEQRANSTKNNDDFLFDSVATTITTSTDLNSGIINIASSSVPTTEELSVGTDENILNIGNSNDPKITTIDLSEDIMSALLGDDHNIKTNPRIEIATTSPMVLEPVVEAIAINHSNNLIPEVSEQLLSGHLSSFSDTFSSLTNIEQEETDMFWDENMTAFVFPPVYELKKQSDCSTPDCGLSREMTDIQSSCLSVGCISKFSDTKLLFAGKELVLPAVFDNKEISNINIFPLSDYWLIGIVTVVNDDEQGWVYRFDGSSFSALISDETEYQISPRFHHGGGEIAFGGDDEDFLVLYSGYDASAYRFRGDDIEDISEYFGLRVSSQGFKAQILKIGEGQSSIYYICSLDDYKAKIVKIWSKDDLNSAGAFDFSTVFDTSHFRPQSILCSISDSENKKLLISAKVGDGYELWNFQDKGFDNSSLRKVTSVNLKAGDNGLVKAAIISNLGVEAKSESSFSVSLSNKKGSFNEVSPYSWYGFSKLDSELYWQFIFQAKNDPFYSPWFYNMNRLSYLSPEE